jgi:hypothetical protein
MTPSAKSSLGHRAAVRSADPPRAPPGLPCGRRPAPQRRRVLGHQPSVPGLCQRSVSLGRAAAARPPRPHARHVPRPCRGRCRCPGPPVRSPLALSYCTPRCSRGGQARSRNARRSSRTPPVRIACGTRRECSGQLDKHPLARRTKTRRRPRHEPQSARDKAVPPAGRSGCNGSPVSFALQAASHRASAPQLFGLPRSVSLDCGPCYAAPDKGPAPSISSGRRGSHAARCAATCASPHRKTE